MPAAASTRRRFAALSGTLKAGSWLILLTPAFHLLRRGQMRTLRWSDAPEPIPTPHFVHRFCQRVCAIGGDRLASE
jgi:tRNA(Met) cytidine acetyltransferase